jgi:CheY-like chemotaxis protein
LLITTNDDPANTTVQIPSPDRVNNNRFQILLVDDNPSDSHLFQTALVEASSRVKVYWVASGEEALEYVASKAGFKE